MHCYGLLLYHPSAYQSTKNRNRKANTSNRKMAPAFLSYVYLYFSLLPFPTNIIERNQFYLPFNGFYELKRIMDTFSIFHIFHHVFLFVKPKGKAVNSKGQTEWRLQCIFFSSQYIMQINISISAN